MLKPLRKNLPQKRSCVNWLHHVIEVFLTEFLKRFQLDAEKEMSEAREFVRKMNIVSTKDKDEKATEDSSNDASNKVTFYISWKLCYNATFNQNLLSVFFLKRIMTDLKQEIKYLCHIIWCILGMVIHFYSINKVIICISGDCFICMFYFQRPLHQKFGLLEALLNVGAWSQAEKIMSNLPTYYAVSYPAIATALCNLIHVTVDPVQKR